MKQKGLAVPALSAALERPQEPNLWADWSIIQFGGKTYVGKVDWYTYDAVSDDVTVGPVYEVSASINTLTGELQRIYAPPFFYASIRELKMPVSSGMYVELNDLSAEDRADAAANVECVERRGGTRERLRAAAMGLERGKVQ
jgi:hypothetical protein